MSGQGPAQGDERRNSGSQSVAKRFSRKKAVAWVAGLVSLAIGAFVTAYFTSLGNHAAALLPRTSSPSTTSSPWETGGLTVAESAKYYRVSLPIYNKQADDRFGMVVFPSHEDCHISMPAASRDQGAPNFSNST